MFSRFSWQQPPSVEPMTNQEHRKGEYWPAWASIPTYHCTPTLDLSSSSNHLQLFAHHLNICSWLSQLITSLKLIPLSFVRWGGKALYFDPIYVTVFPVFFSVSKSWLASLSDSMKTFLLGRSMSNLTSDQNKQREIRADRNRGKQRQRRLSGPSTLVLSFADSTKFTFPRAAHS